MKVKIIIALTAVCLFIATSVLIMSCSPKRQPPTIAELPTSTRTMTYTPQPTSTNTPTATVTMTATITPTPLILHYGFDTDLETWVGDTAFSGATWVNAGQILAGAGSVRFDFSLSATGDIQGGFGIYVNAIYPLYNFTGKTITANIWVPAAMVGQPYAVSIYAMTGTGWNWQNGWITMDSGGITGDAWNAFTWSPVGVGEDIIQSFGVQIQQNGAPDFTGTLYIDEITVN